MKKILTITLILILAVTFTVVCYAEEGTPTAADTTAIGTTSILPTETTVAITSVNALPTVTTAAEGENLPTEEDEESFAQYCLNWIIDNASEILSSLSLLGTVIICVIAKKVLLPILSGGLNKVTAIVSEFENIATRLLEKNNSQVSNISTEATNLSTAVRESEEKVERITEAVEKLTASEIDAANDRETVKLVMTMQAELFNELVKNSSMPQWRKDDIEKRYKDILSIINKDSDNV